MDDRVATVAFQDGVLSVPARHESHWRRFGTLPTLLLREAATLIVERNRPSLDEADRTLAVEAFIRDRVLSHD